MYSAVRKGKEQDNENKSQVEEVGYENKSQVEEVGSLTKVST